MVVAEECKWDTRRASRLLKNKTDGQLVQENSSRTENDKYTEVLKRTVTRLLAERSEVRVPIEVRDLSLVRRVQ
jgi:hypothetical protein